MTGKTTSKTSRAAKAERTAARREKIAAQRARERRNRLLIRVAGVVAVAAIVGGLYAVFRGSGGVSAGGVTPRSDYQVGKPGTGQTAPDFTLASSAGGQVTLSGLRGKTVLLYFQEGLTCQPCWDQIKDIDRAAAQVKAAGIDQVLSITTDPANLIAQKTSDMGLKTPVLADPAKTASHAYHATDYHMSMMGDVDGHSFVIIGPDGTIKWRADYGGAPKETMYLPVSRLLNDIKAGNR
jgi:peroxiredoxin Q/BCP